MKTKENRIRNAAEKCFKLKIRRKDGFGVVKGCGDHTAAHRELMFGVQSMRMAENGVSIQLNVECYLYRMS